MRTNYHAPLGAYGFPYAAYAGPRAWSRKIRRLQRKIARVKAKIAKARRPKRRNRLQKRLATYRMRLGKYKSRVALQAAPPGAPGMVAEPEGPMDVEVYEEEAYDVAPPQTPPWLLPLALGAGALVLLATLTRRGSG